MDSAVKKLYELTKLLHDVVQREEPKEHREVQIEQITKLLNDRQNLLEQIKPPYNEEEKQVGTKIVKLNEAIDQQLDKLFYDIKMDIKQLRVQKVKTTKYSNPYESLTTDGIFFDKRN